MTAAASAAPTLAVARDVLGTKPRARRGMTRAPLGGASFAKRVVVFDRWFRVQRRNRRAALADEVHGWKSHFRFLVFFVGAEPTPPTKTQPM